MALAELATMKMRISEKHITIAVGIVVALMGILIVFHSSGRQNDASEISPTIDLSIHSSSLVETTVNLIIEFTGLL